MNHFEIRDGVLHAEDVSVETIAHDVGTPFYCYSTATLTRHYTVFADAFADIDAPFPGQIAIRRQMVHRVARIAAGLGPITV